MRVLFVASEYAPLVKTGGLADVVAALPKALAARGVEARVLIPAYPAVRAALGPGAGAVDLGPLHGGPARLLSGRAEGVSLLALDAPHLYDRPGNPYLGPDRRDWPDNAVRFGALSRVAADIARDGAFGWRADVLHAHDWQAGLAPAYLRLGGIAVPSVLTIHNVAFQGIFPADLLGALGLPGAAFTPDGLEYYGQIGFLKAGLVYADRITTVSPTYARELMTTEFGFGLEGVISARRGVLSGILNGVDLTDWNPEGDPALPAPFSVRSRRGKAQARVALAARMGLAFDPARPLFCVVSRLTRQKGLDLLLAALPTLLGRGAQLAVLGSGDADLEAGFARAAAESAGRIGTQIGYDEPLSHLMIAGADCILVPSRFEPCGLTQMYGLRYGTLPLVARTGGLADTVIEANAAAVAAGVATGFVCEPDSLPSLADAIDRACDAFADTKLWDAMVRQAMRHPVGWDASAARYARLYAELSPA